VISNGRGIDAILVDDLNTVLGCSSYQAPDLADNGTMVEACALDELIALFWQQQPVALVPAGDHMVVSLVNGQENLAKLNAYRRGVGQHPLNSLSEANTTLYCQALGTIAPARLQSWSRFASNLTTPDATIGTNFMSYMYARLIDTWNTLNCTSLLNLPVPVSVANNNQGVAVNGTVVTQTNLIPASAFEAGGEYYNPPRNITRI
jgi:hypothetical protein